MYKFLSDTEVLDLVTGRVIFLNDPETPHLLAYLAWAADGNTALPADALPVLTAAEQCSAACLSRCQEVDMLYATKIYTDATVSFPDGDKVIQFRDSVDRSNLESVCAGATALVALGQGETQMVYRTIDDVNQAVTAAQMAAIGLSVLSIKQAITNQRWAHKDAICGIEADLLKSDEQKLIDIAAYDIQVGW